MQQPRAEEEHSVSDRYFFSDTLQLVRFLRALTPQWCFDTTQSLETLFQVDSRRGYLLFAQDPEYDREMNVGAVAVVGKTDFHESRIESNNGTK